MIICICDPKRRQTPFIRPGDKSDSNLSPESLFRVRIAKFLMNVLYDHNQHSQQFLHQKPHEELHIEN